MCSIAGSSHVVLAESKLQMNIKALTDQVLVCVSRAYKTLRGHDFGLRKKGVTFFIS